MPGWSFTRVASAALLLALAGCSAPGEPRPRRPPAPTPATSPAAPGPIDLGDLLRREHRRLYEAAAVRRSTTVFNLMTATEHEARPISPGLAAEVAALPTWTGVMDRLGQALDMDVVIEESHLMAILVPRQRFRTALRRVPLAEAAALLGQATGKPARLDPALPPVEVDLTLEGGWRELFAAALAQVGPPDVFTLDDEVRAVWLTTTPPPADRQWSPLDPDPDRAIHAGEAEDLTGDEVRLLNLEDPVRLDCPAPPVGRWGAFLLRRDPTQPGWRLVGWVVRLAGDD